jgi:DNA-binding beta-propeller fold protein YncE
MLGKQDAVAMRLPAGTQPTALTWAGPDLIRIAAYGSGSILEINTKTGEIVRQIVTGGKPMGLRLSGDTLLVADYGLHRVAGFSVADGSLRFSVPVERHPVALAVTPDGRNAISGGLLPGGPGSTRMATSLVLIDVAAARIRKTIPLPVGSSNLRDVSVSKDGRFAFASHTIGRIALPTTQPDRGWINTNALTVLDLTTHERTATFLLDQPNSGAADPWGVAALPDGRVAVSASGTGNLILFDWPRARLLLDGDEVIKIAPANPEHSDPGTPGYGGSPAQLWRKISEDPDQRHLLSSDLAVTTGAGLAPRIRVAPPGLRALAVSPDGGKLAAVSFFDQALLILDAVNGNIMERIPLGERVPETLARHGERLFHDATLAFQSWMSCATCHHEGRTDGMNWDNLNDGIGNPKNTKTLLDCPRTEPMTWLGAREDHLLSIRKGFHFFMSEPEEPQIQAISAYFDSLQAEPSPHLERLADGSHKLSESATRGEQLFRRLDCASCHSGPLRTDQKKHDVGTGSTEDGQQPYDTPPLTELWRTGPYLHDGSAATLREVFATVDAQMDHADAELSTRELDDLANYLLSL